MRALLVFSLVASLPLSSFAATAEPSYPNTVQSEDDLVSLLESTQESLQGISPPSQSMYVARLGVALPVDWSGFGKKTTKYMAAYMDQYGLPRYALLVYEDVVTRERVVALAASGFELARIPAPKDYAPDSFYASMLAKGGVYNDFMGWIFDPAHTAVLVELVPDTLYPAYVQYEGIPTVETSGMMPTAMAASYSATNGPPVPGGGGGGGTNTNAVVDVQVTMTFPLAEGFGSYLVLYGRQNLLYGDWELMEDWIPTYGADSVDWFHAASSNKNCFYYQYFPATDSDMDGISDIVEERSGTSTNGFCDIDSDGDGMLDAWELKLFGDLGQDVDDDFDGEGLLNGEELVWYADNTVVMFSDPGLADSDGDALDDYYEAVYLTLPFEPDSDGDGLEDGYEVFGIKTDPLNPDRKAPNVTFN